MSTVATIQIEQALTKVFEYMKHKTDDISEIPKFSSTELQHLLAIAKFVEVFADTTFLPWVADNDPLGVIDNGGSATKQTEEDD